MRKWRVVVNVIHPVDYTAGKRFKEVVRYYDINLFDHQSLFVEVNNLILSLRSRFPDANVFLDHLGYSFGR